MSNSASTEPAGTIDVTAEPSYENIAVCCPSCQTRIVYNRATDLNDFTVSSRRLLACLNCSASLAVTCDEICERYEHLIYDADLLIAEKQYARCILNYVQSFEVMFAQYLYRVVAVAKLEETDSTDECNRLAGEVYCATERFTFPRLRMVFLHHVLHQRTAPQPLTADESLAELRRWNTLPDEAQLRAISDPVLAELLVRLRNTTVADRRNAVVHKYAYRPTLAEVEEVRAEARQIVLPLGAMFCELPWPKV